MFVYSDYTMVIRSAWTAGEIASDDCLVRILEYIDRRNAGWPKSTVTGIYVGGFRTSYPICAALVDAQISASRELTHDECTAIVAKVRKGLLEELGSSIAQSLEQRDREKRELVEAASWALRLAT